MRLASSKHTPLKRQLSKGICHKHVVFYLTTNINLPLTKGVPLKVNNSSSENAYSISNKPTQISELRYFCYDDNRLPSPKERLCIRFASLKMAEQVVLCSDGDLTTYSYKTCERWRAVYKEGCASELHKYKAIGRDSDITQENRYGTVFIMFLNCNYM